MQHYLDLHLRPDPDTAAHHLLAALYARLHRGLVELDTTQIGVSFPGHDDTAPSLGSHLRLHGAESALERLMATPWLKGIGEHLSLSGVALVPAGSSHRQVTRVQAKSSPARLRRRAMRRHGWDAATAAERLPEAAAERLRLPFVTLGSRSTGQAAFPLFIRHGPLLPQARQGPFNRYGLSHEATVPWF
ncbi:type I-F CRISPR-associated endoribonuclease Cas6/Csy4 [Xanthomonas theicola]|uniref:Type I-F CRISPR-associated endoribonuclease Cas6/Csy4 n=1 Tax=Xanthomonas theicola TaxID=56464 RepID=A0A2S6ZBM8_9XANT|nr:type I-F CRISPR-associated endoribonuclease Cas6/Csy4 [Xanthomonas theicola]PPT82509.1 type I-F CRISPR-associated endoribonuclease Cas6/Csy4 [Xanthomonas theicola]QNH25956.1 type I-F CRISPR-associated endoribonuclease Cas6/Csy4 [Xanthomonas theicola]